MSNYIKDVSITHFRGYFSTKKVEFAIPSETNGEGTLGLTIIVGENNTGKTSMIETLKLVSQNPSIVIDKEERHEGSEFQIKTTSIVDEVNEEGEETESEVEKTLEIRGGGAIGVSEPDTAFPKVENIVLVSSRRSWNHKFSGKKMGNVGYHSSVLGKDRYEVDSLFARRLVEFEENPALKGALTEILKKLIPGFNFRCIESSQKQQYIEYQCTNGEKHTANLLGEGTISLFRIAQSLVDLDSNQILIIDEPELSLHPQAQKKLAKVISEQAKDKQIIVVTHSPYFIRWDDISKGAKLYKFYKDDNDHVEIGKLNAETDIYTQLSGLEADYRKPQLLDIVAKELFFSSKIVLVEGSDDASLYRRYIHDSIDLDETSFDIFGYGVGGAGNMIKIAKLAHELGCMVYAIFDNDVPEIFDQFQQEFHGIDTISATRISKDDVRDKKNNDTGVIEVEGLFDSSGVLKDESEDEMTSLFGNVLTFFTND